MADAQITTLIQVPHAFRVVRDQIAAILALESEGQQTLATAQNLDPLKWKLRVFCEARNPWEQFVDAPASGTEDASPIVNVTWVGLNPDQAASSTVSGGKNLARYNIDCYGYSRSKDDGGDGHEPGDQAAGKEAARVADLVLNILLSGHYTHLSLLKTVFGRRLESITPLDVQLSDRNVQHIVCARMVFAVDCGHQPPQVQGEPMESLYLRVTRGKNGRLYFDALYGDDS